MTEKSERCQGFSEVLAAIHCLDGKVDTNTKAMNMLGKRVGEVEASVSHVEKSISEWRGGIKVAQWGIAILLAVGGFTLGIIRLVSK